MKTAFKIGFGLRLGAILTATNLLMAWAIHAAPVVSNVRAWQRAGSGMVDIYYDLASVSNSLTVSVLISTNSGIAFNVSPTNVSGDLGSNITPGADKHIMWDAGADLPALYFPNVRVRVTADDGSVQILSGMVLIPADSFTMGDSLGDANIYGNEIPLHSVYISAFYMDKYDVTLAHWQQVYNWATNHGYSFGVPGYGKTANQPVVDVDWCDCLKWCNARSEMEGLTPAYYTDPTQSTIYRTGFLNLTNSCVKWNTGYRLPTEAEWEKAARGGLNGKRFPWGNMISENQANYVGDTNISYDLGPSGTNAIGMVGGTPDTSPAGSFAPNGYGLYDMAGNVWQLCWDWYDPNWYSEPGATQNDTHGPASPVVVFYGQSIIVIRGGAWSQNAFAARCAERGTTGSFSVESWFGFRCVLPAGQ